MPIGTGPGAVLFKLSVLGIMGFLFFPILITVIVSFNPGGFVLPPRGVTLEWYRTAIASEEFRSGMFVSLIVGVASSALANLLGFLMALTVARYDFRGKSALNLFIMSPLLIPSTILGLALFVFLVHAGWGSGPVALIVGHTVLILPFAVRILTASLQSYDRTYEEAAMNVGASKARIFFSITLPIIRTGALASFMLCFIISWNDFPISIFLAPPGWVPLPIEIAGYIKFQYDAVGAALVSLVIFLSGFVILALSQLVGLRVALRSGDR